MARGKKTKTTEVTLAEVPVTQAQWNTLMTRQNSIVQRIQFLEANIAELASNQHQGQEFIQRELSKALSAVSQISKDCGEVKNKVLGSECCGSIDDPSSTDKVN